MTESAHVALYDDYKQLFEKINLRNQPIDNAKELRDNGIPENEEDQLLICVFPFRGEYRQLLTHCRDATTLTSEQLRECLPKALGEGVKSISIGTLPLGNCHNNEKQLEEYLYKNYEAIQFEALQPTTDLLSYMTQFTSIKKKAIVLKADLEDDGCGLEKVD
ncbi:hypothetical protein COEREDRAFT_90041 [Coemansia reversa NRRL 1564]|uniref:Uncharacterized protein n=1 Tax=Coemansia reversa (strain ATCC 12441 / NRRL 1564) TaxID=763665 RepID=A0A2G5B269_COERN|nr:hypothetical protein COEREDRAFT_90041 [Coemansia reversa NRRL 1564]|eukprot:PIA12807.1 hypothetical protein COEREDRAFT_90041 [Coemansia reversa NRRL 1564]